MTRYFVLAYALFVAALFLLLGIGRYPNDNFSVKIYGYGRFGEASTYFAIGALALAAGWNFVQWRKTRTGPATTSIHFVLANVWYVTGLLLLVGSWGALGYPGHAGWTHRVSVFGFGQFETPSVYLTNLILFVVALFSLRRWYKSGRPGVAEGHYFALANAWFLAGIVLLLGIGLPDGRRQIAVYGYGRLEEPSAYLADGLVFLAAFWNFRRWRKAGTIAPASPIPKPVATLVPSGRGPNWPVIVAVALALFVLILLATPMSMTSVSPPLQLPTGPSQVVWMPAVPPTPGGGAPRVTMALAPLLLIFVFGGFAWAYTRKDPHRSNDGPVVWFTCLVLIPLGAFVLLWLVSGASGEQFFRAETVAYFIFFVVLGEAILLLSRRLSRPSPPRPQSVPTPVPVPQPARAEPPRACPKCQSLLAADAPQGLCPRCLMAGAFQSILSPSRTGAYDGPHAAPTPEEVQEFFPNLEILGLLGQGGMGAVYQARQPNLDRTVALKLIRPREDNPMFAERFVREAKAMAKLSHPNIVHIHESGEAGGSLFLIMEFVDGVTLREAIRAKVIPPAEAMKIVGQLCDALEYAHAQGVVHRDIKPENILLDRTGRVKVVDFGLAKLANDNAMSLTHTRQAMGTPHYMAPEQWEKPTEVDHRADIYALGVVIYELLTGELPLGRFDPPSVKARLDARIDEIVLRLLAKEPDRRYQHASDVRTALFNLGPLAAAREPKLGRAGRHGFYEYKSKAEYLGWPLVHVVSGVDPRTGTVRIAKGWIALGDVMAIGVLSLSGVFALGLLSLAGVFSLGLLALGGCLSLGGVSIGGIALGVFSLGGVALGWLACGGVAIGKFALGGATVGEHHFGGTHRDPDFWANLRSALADWFG